MENAHCKPTALDYMIKHLKEVLMVIMEKKVSKRRQTLCEMFWPGFGAEWPPEGILNPHVVHCVWKVVSRVQGYPDQLPHIDSWLEVSQVLSPWK